MNKEPKLLAILGMTGSGKSVLVEMLCKQGIPKVHFDNLEFFVSEVKILIISFACDIGGNPSLCFGGGGYE